MEDEGDPQSGAALWIPEALRGDRALRLKYGVTLKGLPEGGRMSGDQYKRAFVVKLKRLIENESEIPMPVLLDRFFTAPHLAVGNPGQMAEALWSELDEIKRPVTLMNDWLEKQDDDSFNAMIHPRQKDMLGHEPIRDEDIMRELETLSFEEFLEWL